MNPKFLKGFILFFLILIQNRANSATVTTVGNGNWNSTVIGLPWPLGIVPSATDVVIIDNNDIVNLTSNQSIGGVFLNVGATLNMNTNTRTLTVNGSFLMANNSTINGNATSRALVITGDLVIAGPNKTIQNIAISVAGTFWNVSGNITLNTGNTASKYFGNFLNDGTFINNSNNVPFTVGGNFTNNGTFTSGTGRVTFTGATSNTISGSAASTGFGGGITVNKGTSQNNILEVTSVITMVNGGLNLNNGTFKLSSASTIVPFTSNPNILANERLWVNGGTINSTASIDWTLEGALRVDAGSLNFGTAINNRIAPNSTSASTGLIEINGGTLTATGRISSGTDPWIYTMTGGLCQLGTIGNNSPGRDVFNLDNSASGVFSMSGGTLMICNKAGSVGQNLGYHNTATLGSGFTGGILQMGYASTTAGSIIRIESSIPIYNLVINAPGSTVQVQSPATPTTSFLQITNDLTVTAGVFDISNQDIEIGGDWINASATADPLIEGTRRVTFDGMASQSISNTGSANGMVFSNIIVNNTSTVIPQVTLNTTLQAQNGLTLTAGKVNLNSNTFTLGTSAAAPGTLLRTADFVYGGTFTRWFPTALFAIGNAAGLFPMGTSQDDYRPLWVGYSSNLTTGGMISVLHNPTYPSTYVSATHADASWGSTLEGVSNSIWVVTSSALAFNGSTGIIRFGGTGFGNNNLTDMNASLLASVVGTHGAATNVNTTYEVNRTALSTAELVNSWRIGTRNVLSAPLPITLLEFTSQLREGNVALNWKTASEKNSDFIALERSVDGIRFEEIDRKKAQGSSNSLVEYQSIDNKPAPELNYYRLKLADKDGSCTYSKILAERVDFSLSEPLVFPNPTSGNIEIDGPNLTDIVAVSIYNALGEVIRAYSGYPTNIDLSKEPNGAYFVQFTYLDKRLVKKVILSRP